VWTVTIPLGRNSTRSTARPTSAAAVIARFRSDFLNAVEFTLDNREPLSVAAYGEGMTERLDDLAAVKPQRCSSYEGVSGNR
jgi:hypothetical protein